MAAEVLKGCSFGSLLMSQHHTLCVTVELVAMHAALQD
jgi:hypothetical protein